MFRKALSVVVSFVAVLMPPVAALAEPAAPSSPPWSWPGPWWLMGSDGWSSLWWLCPLMMLAMMLMCGIMCFGRHLGRGDPHH